MKTLVPGDAFEVPLIGWAKEITTVYYSDSKSSLGQNEKQIKDLHLVAHYEP